MSQEDLAVQFSQFYACIILLRKLINATKTIPEFEKLLEFTKGFIKLLDKAQHLKNQEDFEQVNEHVRSFKNTIETNLAILKQQGQKVDGK